MADPNTKKKISHVLDKYGTPLIWEWPHKYKTHPHVRGTFHMFNTPNSFLKNKETKKQEVTTTAMN